MKKFLIALVLSALFTFPCYAETLDNITVPLDAKVTVHKEYQEVLKADVKFQEVSLSSLVGELEIESSGPEDDMLYILCHRKANTDGQVLLVVEPRTRRLAAISITEDKNTWKDNIHYLFGGF